jgi:hypothetical protein
MLERDNALFIYFIYLLLGKGVKNLIYREGEEWWEKWEK